MMRGSGVEFDLRKEVSYEVYALLGFSVPVGRVGDCFDRYMVRLEEMRQSIRIIEQVIEDIPAGLTNTRDGKFSLQARKDSKNHMDNLIDHFESSLGLGTVVCSNFDYASTEAPKGEFSVLFYYTPEGRLVRCKVKAPGFYHLQISSTMTNKHLIADVVTVIGTQDIVFGEVDR
jgi:NADH:ubiquinone oxidoreductase subunit D